MALITEILGKERESDDKIYLHREGIFWKAYQRSAFHVIQRRGGMKLTKKYVKTVKCEVVSLGFPDVTLLKMFREEEINKLNEKTLLIHVDKLNPQEYDRWFRSHSLPFPKERSREEEVLAKLREFRIEDATPMDCMIFLNSIRKELAG